MENILEDHVHFNLDKFISPTYQFFSVCLFFHNRALPYDLCDIAIALRENLSFV